MSVWNVFDQDAFSLQSLTSAINKLPFTPTQLGQMGLFEEAGTPNLTVLHEEIARVIALVAVKPRNAPGQVVTNEKAKIFPFTVPHLPQRGSIMADEVQGVREFGSESSVATVEGKRNQLLAKMRRQLDYTIEYHRLIAIQGSFVNVNGDTQSLFGSNGLGSGVTQETIDFALNSSSTKVRSKCLSVQTAVEGKLGGTPYTSIDVLCGATFWDNLITHAAVEATYLNTQMAAALREGLLNTLRFGDLNFMRYRGNSTVALSAKQAYAIPRGVDQMFLTRFAPANYMETVNTTGLPYYVKAKVLDFDKGLDLESQSNPLNICTRPDAVIQLTTP